MQLRIHFYTAFMKKIARHIIEGYLIHRKLVEHEESKKPMDAKHLSYKGNPVSAGSIGADGLNGNGFESLNAQ